MKLVPDCPNCKGFADGRDVHDGKVTVFTWEGTTHAAPSIWLAGHTLIDGTPLLAALEFWAWHCSVETAYERELQEVA